MSLLERSSLCRSVPIARLTSTGDTITALTLRGHSFGLRLPLGDKTLDFSSICFFYSAQTSTTCASHPYTPLTSRVCVLPANSWYTLMAPHEQLKLERPRDRLIAAISAPCRLVDVRGYTKLFTLSCTITYLAWSSSQGCGCISRSMIGTMLRPGRGTWQTTSHHHDSGRYSA